MACIFENDSIPTILPPCLPNPPEDDHIALYIHSSECPNSADDLESAITAILLVGLRLLVGYRTILGDVD